MPPEEDPQVANQDRPRDHPFFEAAWARAKYRSEASRVTPIDSSEAWPRASLADRAARVAASAGCWRMAVYRLSTRRPAPSGEFSTLLGRGLGGELVLVQAGRQRGLLGGRGRSAEDLLIQGVRVGRGGTAAGLVAELGGGQERGRHARLAPLGDERAGQAGQFRRGGGAAEDALVILDDGRLAVRGRLQRRGPGPRGCAGWPTARPGPWPWRGRRRRPRCGGRPG